MAKPKAASDPEAATDDVEVALDDMTLEQLYAAANELGSEGVVDGAVLLGAEPPAVQATYLRAAIAAVRAGEEPPDASSLLEDEGVTAPEPEPEVTDHRADPDGGDAIAAVIPKPGPGAILEHRGLMLGMLVKVSGAHQADGEPSTYAGHTGHLVEIIEDQTRTDDGCPFLVDFGPTSGRDAASFAFDELERVVEQ